MILTTSETTCNLSKLGLNYTNCSQFDNFYHRFICVYDVKFHVGLRREGRIEESVETQILVAAKQVKF